MGKTKIEWATDVWNPVTGCTPVSEGCENCYARRMAYRLRGRCGYPEDEPFRVTLHPDRLEEPYTWRKPRRVFVCSMSDLFHDGVPDDFILRVLEVVADNPEHTFMVLTKRPLRMKEFMEHLRWVCPEDKEDEESWPAEAVLHDGSGEKRILRNLWLGVTAENQARADERIPILLQIPAAVRFVSCEPLLGPVSLYVPVDPANCEQREICHSRITRGCYSFDTPCREIARVDWVIVGGETGPGARPMHPDWVRSLKDQCQATGTPFFLKQMYVDGNLVRMPELDGRRWNELPCF